MGTTMYTAIEWDDLSSVGSLANLLFTWAVAIGSGVVEVVDLGVALVVVVVLLVVVVVVVVGGSGASVLGTLVGGGAGAVVAEGGSIEPPTHPLISVPMVM